MKIWSKSFLLSPVHSVEHVVTHFGGGEKLKYSVNGTKFCFKFSNEIFICSNSSIPPSIFCILIGLVSLPVLFGSISESFLVGDVSINNFKIGLASGDSCFSIGNGRVADFEEGLKCGDLLEIVLVGIKSGSDKVVEEVLEEVGDFLGGRFVGEVLGDFDEGLGEVGKG